MAADPVSHGGLAPADDVSATAAAGRRPFPLQIPFVDELGLELWGFGAGHAELRIDLAPEHFNSLQVAHGGVLMTMLDVAMAHAARSLMPAESHGTPGLVTIEMKTTFVRAAKGRLRALGHVLHKTATLAFTEGRVVDDSGGLCAHATGTFKYLRALPGGRREDTGQDAISGSGASPPSSPTTQS